MKYPNRTHYSQHFTRAELDCRCGRHGSKPKKHSVVIRRRLRKLAVQLEAFRREYGKPVKIVSGYRCVEHNKEVNGAVDSQHLHARAADIHVPNRGDAKMKNQREMLAAAERVPAFKNGGIGVYPNGGLHLDRRGWRARWNSWIGQKK